MASQPSSPIAHVPDDVLLDIFSVCSPRNLAACTQVSQKFLLLASPILYRTVVLHTQRQLQALFHRRSITIGWKKFAVVPSSLQPFLSLDQIRTLHLLDTSGASGALCLGRFEDRKHPRIQLDHLIIDDSRYPIKTHPGSLFHILRPTHLTLVHVTCYPIVPMEKVIGAFVGQVETLTLVDHHVVRPWTYFRVGREGNRFRLVLRGKAFDINPKTILREERSALACSRHEEILLGLQQEGVLSFEGFRDVEGAAVVEVAGEEELALVESGMKALSEKERKLLRVQVRGSRWWEEK